MEEDGGSVMVQPGALNHVGEEDSFSLLKNPRVGPDAFAMWGQLLWLEGEVQVMGRAGAPLV